MIKWDLIIDPWTFPIAIEFRSTSTAASKSSAPVEDVEEQFIGGTTYSGIDAGFYDSPSGETITEYSSNLPIGSKQPPGKPDPIEFRDYRAFFLPPGYPPQLLPGFGLIPHYLFVMDKLTEGTEYHYTADVA